VQVEGVLGRSDTKERVAGFESVLAPMYAALPKNAWSRLAQPTVRYALHRLFARSGRFVSGLDIQGGSWNESSTPTAVLSERVPLFVESVFEERLADHGFGLHDLATLAVALNHLFKTEATSRLEVAYRLKDISLGDTLDEAKVYETLDMHLMIFLLERNLDKASWVVRAQRKIDRIYPGWADARMWAHDLRRNLAFEERHRTNPFVPRVHDFGDLLHIVEEMEEQYGVSQDAECKELKDSLLEHEFGNTGRVRLADFYGRALQGKWQLSEHKDYLRQLGALDESNPLDPRVVVPNYLYSKTNCVAKSSYYDVCCINECDALFEHVEHRIAKQEATPQEVAAVISQLSSSTVPAPRNLSQVLLERLRDVAATNRGVIPIHGRLFFQFMHHVYPRECPYPHVSGTTRPLTAAQWINETGGKHVASKEEMQQHAQSASWNTQGFDTFNETEMMGDEQLLPWSDEEELPYSQEQLEVPNAKITWLRAVLLFSGIVAGMCSLAKTALSAWSSVDAPPAKYFV
jgi:hypothetical protein